MRNKFLLLLMLFLSTFIFIGLIVDDEKIGILLQKLGNFTSENPQEKVHIHFDKPYYSVGDDIWFKAYVVNAEKNQLSSLSKVLYLDIIDERDSVNKTMLLPIENGFASGNINLIDSLFIPGNYHIRAYTSWMKNFDAIFFFHKTVQIGDAINSKILGKAEFNLTSKNDQNSLAISVAYQDFTNNPVVNKDVSYNLIYKNEIILSDKTKTDESGKINIIYNLRKNVDPNNLILNTLLKKSNTNIITQNFKVQNQLENLSLQFFPEGGNLISGIRSKIAFKATGNNGLGIDIDGYVIENEGLSKVAELKVDHAGMGLFSLTPQYGKSYTAVIATKNGSEKRYALPKAITNGYVLTLNHLDSNYIVMRIECSPSLINNNPITIVTQSNGITGIVTKLIMNKGILTSKVPKNLFPNGINQFTLFTSEAIPVAERLIFIKQKDKFSVTITSSKKQYSKHEKVNLIFDIKDEQFNGLVGSYSISVVNKDKVNLEEEEETTINSNLLLTSDLKGNIEKPNYYFTHVNEQKNRSLDLLMLTQGWRRFGWETIQRYEKNLLTHKKDRGLSISGTITSLNNKPIPYGKVNLFVPSMVALIDTIADANGHFVFDELNFSDSTKFVVRAKNSKDRNSVKIKLDTYQSPKISYSKIIEGQNNPSFVNYLYHTEKTYNLMGNYGMMSKNLLLKEVEIKSRRTSSIARSSLPDGVYADYTLTPDKLQTAGNVYNILSQFPGVMVRYIQFEGNVVVGRYQGVEGRMLLLLDGLPIENLDGIDPRSLAGVEIIRGGSNSLGAGITFTGTHASANAKYGIIFLTMENKATKYNSYTTSGLTLTKPKGYAITKEFYSPTYDVINKNDKMVDLRSTIYWNPNLITDNSGNLNINFFTADEAGNYLVTIEGVTIEGYLVRKTYYFEVK